MTKITPNTSNQLTTYIPPAWQSKRSTLPTPNAPFARSTSKLSTDGFDGESIRASVAEQIGFLIGRAWTRLVSVDYLEGVRHRIGRLPPPDWYERFTSDHIPTRCAAYWDNRDGEVGLVTFIAWESFTNCLFIEKRTSDIILLHMILTRLFGNISYDAMLSEARDKEKKVALGRLKRHYQARILRTSYTSLGAISGEVHHREEGYIRGMVKAVRETYHSIVICLEDAEIKRKLALVPRSYYEEFMPKKTLSRAGLECDTASIDHPGPTLWQNFKIRMKETFEAPPSNPGSAHFFEMDLFPPSFN